MPTNMGKLQVAPHNPGETDGQHPPNYNFYLVGKTAGNIHLFSRSQNLHIMAKCWCYDCQLKFLNKHIAGLNMQEEAMKLLRKCVICMSTFNMRPLPWDVLLEIKNEREDIKLTCLSSSLLRSSTGTQRAVIGCSAGNVAPSQTP